MKYYPIGITSSGLGKTKLSPDTTLIQGRITGAAGMMRPYGDLHRTPATVVSGGSSGAFWVFGDMVIE